MKKRFSLLLVPMLALGLASCGDGGSDLTWIKAVEKAETFLGLSLAALPDPAGFDLKEVKYVEAGSTDADKVATIQLGGFIQDYVSTYTAALEGKSFVLSGGALILAAQQIKVSLSSAEGDKETFVLIVKISKHTGADPDPDPDPSGDGWTEAVTYCATTLGVSMSLMSNPNITGATYEKDVDEDYPGIKFNNASEDAIWGYLDMLEASKGFEWAVDTDGDDALFAPGDIYAVYPLGDSTGEVLVGIWFYVIERGEEAEGVVTAAFPHQTILNFFKGLHSKTPTWPAYAGEGTEFETYYYEEDEEYWTEVYVYIDGCTAADITAYNTLLGQNSYELYGVNDDGYTNYYSETDTDSWEVYTKYDTSYSVGVIVYQYMYS